jgi:quercetin dioxygenase-like cupin family protein
LSRIAVRAVSRDKALASGPHLTTLADRGRKDYGLFSQWEVIDMSSTEGFVVPPGGGKHFNSPTPGRCFDLKLLRQQTNDSIMMFEETLPPGTASLFHLHHDSDEVAWVLAGEFTFMIGDAVSSGGPGTCAFMPRDIPHAWKNTGTETGRVLFLYTPAAAGGYIEALSEDRPANEDDREALLDRHRWKVIGPNPL